MRRTDPDEWGREGVDSDVDLTVAAERTETLIREWDLLAAIAVGGAIGAEARYGLAELLPHASAGWPWSTLLANVLGCLLIGVLMVVVGELRNPPRLLRPMLGVGVFGGFTTFSTFALDTATLVDAHRPGLAAAYAVTSLLACVVAVTLAVLCSREVARLVVR